MQLISLRDALALLDSGKPCTITFCTYDEQRKTGGDWCTYEGCIWVSTYYKEGVRRVKLPNGKVRSIHTMLITRINGMKVIW